MKEVYIIWKDYGGGDYIMVCVHATELGACNRVRELFFDAKSSNQEPFWNDGKLHEEDHLSFKCDSYEVEAKKVPVLS